MPTGSSAAFAVSKIGGFIAAAGDVQPLTPEGKKRRKKHTLGFYWTGVSFDAPLCSALCLEKIEVLKRAFQV